MIDYNAAIENVLHHEGSYSENPNDSGGVTKYGISLRFIRSLPADKLKLYGINYADGVDQYDIRELTLDQAKALYKGEFWDHMPLEQLTHQSVANYIFDMAINMGIAPAIKCAQRAVWAILRQREVLIDDGIMGNQTLYHVNLCGETMLPAMRSERAGYYRLIVSEAPQNKAFMEGWLNRAYER